jgi:hypothetical protein
MPRRKPGKQQPRRGENLGNPCSETLAFMLCNNAKPATSHRPVAQLCLFMSPFGNFPAMYQSDSHFLFLETEENLMRTANGSRIRLEIYLPFMQGCTEIDMLPRTR